MTPIFAHGHWVIVTQTVRRRGQEIEVPVRWVTCTPELPGKDGKLRHFPLGKNSFLQLVMIDTRSVRQPLYVQYHPNKGFRLGYSGSLPARTQWEEQGERKREKEDWFNPHDFMSHMARFGEPIALEAIRLLREGASSAP